MSKKTNEIEIEVKVDPAGLIHILEQIKDYHTKSGIELDAAIARIRGDQPKTDEPEFRIIEQGAIPAAYYYRESVQAAILEEIKRDYKVNGEVAPGVELINGTTKETSDSENDITVGGDGSEPSKDGPDDGTKNGSRGASDPGGKSKDTPKTGTGEKTSGSK